MKEINISKIVGTSFFSCRPLQVKSSNQLFKIDVFNTTYILKTYKHAIFFEKELGVMYLFMKEKCKTPELIKYSKDISSYWILYKYITGVPLQEVAFVSNRKLSCIFRQIGQALNKIHSVCIIDQSEEEKKKNEYLAWLRKNIENNIRNVDNKNKVLLKASQYLMNNYHILSDSFFGCILYDFNDKHILIEKTGNKWKLNSFIDFEETIFGCVYTDIVGLYISYLLENQDCEKSFWNGYGIETNNLRHYQNIAFFLLQYGIEMCTVLSKINSNHFDFGLSIINKTLIKYHNYLSPRNSLLTNVI